jgi:hypothetical protein
MSLSHWERPASGASRVRIEFTKSVTREPFDPRPTLSQWERDLIESHSPRIMPAATVSLASSTMMNPPVWRFVL